MTSQANQQWIAFSGTTCLAEGAPPTVLESIYNLSVQDQATVLIFDAQTSRLMEVDWRGSLAEVQARFTAPTNEPRSVGRPKLGVVAKEITLLPRHWEWLSKQSGGASVALRKLVEQALRAEDSDSESKRQAQEACYRFMQAMAGDFPVYEEALRALYANDLAKLQAQITAWPTDIKAHVLELAERAIH